MGKYIGENIQYGSFERQKITLEYDPITESVVNTYTLTQRVSNESSIFVVCDKILLQPVKDYVIVKEGFSQKIRFKIDLDAIEDSDQTIGNVEIYVVYLGKELLNSSVPSVANIQDVTINNETLAAGQVLAYTSEGWKNRDVGDILSLGGSYPSLFDEVEFLKNTSAPRTWVQTQLSNLKNEILDSPPGVLDTLNELAAALGDDANFATTVAGQIGAVESDVSALDVRVVALETDTQSINSDISTLTDRVSTNETDIDNLESEIELKVDSSNLASSAYSGSYTDLIDTPTLATVATSGSYDDLLNTILKNTSPLLAWDKSFYFGEGALSSYSDANAVSSNIAFGPNALHYLSSGSNNISIGTISLGNFTSGSYNLAIGAQALVLLNQGFQNIGLGDAAGMSLNEGRQNIFLGAGAGADFTSGDYNVFLGGNNGSLLSNTSNNVLISDGQGNARIRIDSLGKTGINTTTPNGQLTIQTTNETAGLIVKSDLLQTANLFELQSSSGTALFSIDKDGNVAAGTVPVAHVSGLTAVATSGSYNDLFDIPALANVATSGSYNDLADKPIAVVPGLNATQGQFLAHNGTEFVSTNTLEVSDPANQPLIIKGAALQSANLLELRDSTDSVVTYIKPDGTISTRRFVENVANSFNTTLAPTSGALTINTLLGTCVLGTLTSSVTSWNFTNVPTDSGKSTMVSVVLSGNTAYTYGDACTVNGASVSGGIKWCAGIVPTSTSGTDIISFLIIRDQSGTVQVFGSATTNFS
jgi:hypothetical protein